MRMIETRQWRLSPDLLCLQPSFVSIISRLKPAIIRNILAQSQRPADILGGNVVAGILILNAFGTGFELLQSSVVPPVPHVPDLVVFPTLIVKSVRQFVTHHNSHCTIIDTFGVPVKIQDQVYLDG